jgi:hypothetical protein
MYGLGIRQASMRAITAYRFTSTAANLYKIPALQMASSNSTSNILSTRMQNLAFSFDHFLFEESSGDLEATEDELISITKNIEGIWSRNY